MTGTPNTTFGLPPTKDEEIAALKAQLAEANAKIIAAGAAADEPVRDLDSQGFEKKYVKVRIFKGSRPDDLQRVPLGIRGYTIQVERGPEVIMHKAFAEVLDQAVEGVVESSDGGLVLRQTHRFPFQILGPATEAEYLAFSATMKAGASSATVRA